MKLSVTFRYVLSKSLRSPHVANLIKSNYTSTVKVLSNSYLFTSSLTETAVGSLTNTVSAIANGLGVSNFALTDNS